MHVVLRTIEAFTQARKGWRVSTCRLAIVGIAAFSLQACSMTGKGLDDASVGAVAIVDSSATTMQTPFDSANDAEGAERDRLLDEDTIRNAVTSADLKSLKDGPLPWANQSTGSSGVITEIAQTKESGQTCRSFTAVRSAYDGVTRYEGEVCLDRRSGWWTRLLHPLGLAQDS